MDSNNLSRRGVLRAATLAGTGLAGLAPWLAHAQARWPVKPVNMVVPFAAGGGTDAFGRPLAAQFAKQTGQNLVIENRGGAGGTLGAGVAAKAAPDGYNIFMGAVHHTIAPSMYRRLDYDLEKDFVPLLLAATVPQVVVAAPALLARYGRPSVPSDIQHIPCVRFRQAGVVLDEWAFNVGPDVQAVPVRGPLVLDDVVAVSTLLSAGLASSGFQDRSSRAISMRERWRLCSVIFP